MSAPPPYSAPPSYATATKNEQYGYEQSPPPPVGFQGGYGQPAAYAPPPPPNVDPVQPSYTTTSSTALRGMNTSSYDTNYDTEGMGDIASFSDKAVRHAFIRKVYLILMTQLLITVGFICLFMFAGDVKTWVQQNSWFYYISYGVFLATMITLVCCPGFRRNYPWNFICLLVFTLAFSYMVGTIASFYDTMSVVSAAGITAAVCLSITIFALQTKMITVDG